MKLIDAMNQLKLTDKKLTQKQSQLARYAARPNFREDAFKKDGKDGEAEFVKQTLQACSDLVTQHENLKRSLDYSNLMHQVEVGGRKYSLHSLILHKRSLIRMKKAVWASLNDGAAQMEVNQLRMKQGSEAKLNVQVVYNYDLREREEKIEELTDLEAQIDSALQIANAKLDLLDPPKA